MCVCIYIYTHTFLSKNGYVTSPVLFFIIFVIAYQLFSKLIENNKKINDTKAIFLFVLSLLFVCYIYLPRENERLTFEVIRLQTEIDWNEVQTWFFGFVKVMMCSVKLCVSSKKRILHIFKRWRKEKQEILCTKRLSFNCALVLDRIVSVRK